MQSVVELVVTRVNTINGLRYSEDPTILAWEVRSWVDWSRACQSINQSINQ